jgi:hypothetical protein
MLWPSKLSIVLSLPRPLLWVGPQDGATARQLCTRPHTGVFVPGQASDIAEWLLALRNEQPRFAATDLFDAQAQRCEALAAWCALIEKRSYPNGVMANPG